MSENQKPKGASLRADERGRTVADFLFALIDSRSRATTFLGLLGLVMAGGLGGMVAFQWITGTEVDVVDYPIGVHFRATRPSRDVYYFGMHPQGWQSTGIPVHGGQTASVIVSGSAHVNFDGLISKVLSRKSLELETMAAFSLNPDADGLGSTPEEHFTPAQLARLKSDGSGPAWLTADGTPFGEWKGRVARRVMPDAPLGAVIGQVRGKDGVSELFLIGRNATSLAMPIDGVLWVTVNDVVFEPVPELFFEDNAGAYLLMVTVQ